MKQLTSLELPFTQVTDAGLKELAALTNLTYLDLSLTQDVFAKVSGRRHSGQIRLDITNFGNLLNKTWGVGMRLVNNQILTSPQADAQGRLSYQMQVSGGSPLTTPLQTNAGINDVYVMMLSFRYTFQ